MDELRFDALSRDFATGLSRRSLTRLLGALTLVGPFAAYDAAPVDAAKSKKKRRKKRAAVVPPVLPPASPPPVSPPPPPPPPPPTCQGVFKSCATGSCCDGLTCGNNFCVGGDPPPVCCGAEGASCTQTCDCCNVDSFCSVFGECATCPHQMCGNDCLNGAECCTDLDCDSNYFCYDGYCYCPNANRCNNACCDFAGGEVCVSIGGDTNACQAGGCAGADICAASPQEFICGNESNVYCLCATAIGGQTVCTNTLALSCELACSSDADCAGLDPDAVCLPGGGPYCNVCGGQNYCVMPCASGATVGAAERHGAASGPQRSSATAPVTDQRTARDTAQHVSSARSARRSRRGRRRRR